MTDEVKKLIEELLKHKDELGYLIFDKYTVAGEEEWDWLCQFADFDPEKTKSIKLYVVDAEVDEGEDDEDDESLIYVITYRYKSCDFEETDEYDESEEEDAQEAFEELIQDKNLEYAIFEEVTTNYVDYEEREIIRQYWAD